MRISSTKDVVFSFGLLALCLVIIGCGTPSTPSTASTPSTTTDAEAQQSYAEVNALIHRGKAKLNTFRKTNGVMQERNGAAAYRLDYEADLECLTTENFGLGASCQTGQVFTDKGAMVFENTERGWTARQLVSSVYPWLNKDL